MSEQENTSGRATADRGSPVVVLEATSSKHTLPYKPSDLQDDVAPDLHQKRAPAMASKTENLKSTTEVPVTKDIMENEYAMSSERHKNIAKKLSSNISSKRRASPTPVSIPMTPIEIESKMDEIIMMAAPVQPIPPQVSSPMPSTDRKKEDTPLDKKDDDESITSEITELRTPEAAKKTPEWENNQVIADGNIDEVDESVALQRELVTEAVSPIQQHSEGTANVVETSTSSQVVKKKEITWNDNTYLDQIPLQESDDRSASLERKTSVGPCYRRGGPSKQRSGITICLPKKSSKNITITSDECKTIKSGISITVSKRCLDHKTKAFAQSECEIKRAKESTLKMGTDGVKIEEENYSKYCANLRGKLDNMYSRIKQAFRI